MMSECRYSFVDFFSGAGLFSEGFVQAGLVPIKAFDLDKNAISSYNRNVAPVGVVGDVCKADLAGVAADVIIAGPPCQGFSTLGRRDPSDVRNSLSRVLPAYASKLNASIMVVENVPQFVGSEHHIWMKHSMSRRGYRSATWFLEATDFGSRQYRRRAFTIFSRDELPECPRPTGVLNVCDSVFLDIEPSDPMNVWMEPSPLAKERFELVPAGGDKRDILEAKPEICPDSWLRTRSEATDVWGRMRLGIPSNTIRCSFLNPSKGRYIHPTLNRTISLREAARLQGIPDHWTLSGRPYSVARQIGNGVPIILAKAVAAAVRDALENNLLDMAQVA